MSFDDSLCPPGTEVNPMDEPRENLEELRKWAAEWLGVSHLVGDGCILLTPPSVGFGDITWRPDQNIAQAWLLVEKLVAGGHIVEIESPSGPMRNWFVWIDDDAGDIAETAPLAILKACRAAAKALEQP